MLARWATSPVGVARSVYQGIRRLVLAVYYSQPESFADIGYLGPLHERALEFPGFFAARACRCLTAALTAGQGDDAVALAALAGRDVTPSAEGR